MWFPEVTQLPSSLPPRIILPMKPGILRGALVAAVALSVVQSASLIAQKGAQNSEWREYGGDLGATKYSPLNQINASNINDLTIAWRWPSPDREIQTSDP